MPPRQIPSFLLYGEDLAETPPSFGHIETIAARSSLYDWEISPHRHVHGTQALMVFSGQVEFQCDGDMRLLEAPCFMVVPPGSVHGFRFSPETGGYVLSLSASFAVRARDAADGLLGLLTQGKSGPIPEEDLDRAKWLCAEMLAVQADWRRPRPLFLSLAEALLHSLAPADEQGAAAIPDDARLAGFRRLVELHLREHRTVDWYASQLGTTSKTLTRACRHRLDCTPTALIHARLALEAQRLLRFTNASVVQVSEELGFSDSSYFSRFYQRMTGRRPLTDKGGVRR